MGEYPQKMLDQSGRSRANTSRRDDIQNTGSSLHYVSQRRQSDGHWCNMYRKFGEIWTCDMRVVRQTDKQTDTFIAIMRFPTAANGEAE